MKATAEVCPRWTIGASSHWTAVLCHAGPVDGEATGRHAGTAALEAPTKAEEVPGVERLLALSDGVVAIAITLLVLQLGGSRSARACRWAAWHTRWPRSGASSPPM